MSALAVPGLAILLQRFLDLQDLGSRLWSGSGDVIIRVSLALFVGVLFGGLLPWRKREGGRLTPFLGLSIVSMMAAVGFLDQPAVALTLLAAAGATSAMVWVRWGSRDSLAGWMALGVSIALLSSTGWEITYRMQQKTAVQEDLLPAMAPPTAAEIGTLADELEESLGAIDGDESRF